MKRKGKGIVSEPTSSKRPKLDDGDLRIKHIKEREVGLRIKERQKATINEIRTTQSQGFVLVTSNMITSSRGAPNCRFESFALSFDGTFTIAFANRYSDSFRLMESIMLRVENTDLAKRSHYESSLHTSSFALSGNGKFALGAGEGVVTLNEIRGLTLRNRHVLFVSSDDPIVCAISYDGSIGLTAAYDNTAILWDLKTYKKVKVINTARFNCYPGGTDAFVNKCHLSHDGKVRILSSLEIGLIVWTEAGIEHPIKNNISHSALSPDGNTVLLIQHKTYYEDIIFWSVPERKVIHKTMGCPGNVVDCAIFADGKHGISVDEEGMYLLWSISDVKPVNVIDIPPGLAKVVGCAVSSDGKCFLSCSDTHIGLWKDQRWSRDNISRILGKHLPFQISMLHQRIMEAMGGNTVKDATVKRTRPLETFHVCIGDNERDSFMFTYKR